MSGVKLFKPSEVNWFDWESGSRLAEIVGSDISKTILGYLGEFNNCNIPWRLEYDALVLGMEGSFQVHVGDTIFELGCGDVLWLPEGSELAYVAEYAKVFFTMYPADWETNKGPRPGDLPHTVNTPLLVRRSDLQMTNWAGDAEGICDLGIYVGSDVSGTMGCSLGLFDRCSIPWTVHYDEILVVLDGHYLMPAGDELFEADAGDILWLPNGTDLRYEGDKALVFASMYPVNWRERQQASDQ